MADHRLADCLTSESKALERVNYFSRMLVTEGDMTADQDYFRQKLRRHNRFLHGWGTVCGLEVVPVSGIPLCVEIQPGYALGPYGDEIFVSEPVRLDLTTCGGEATTDPCEPGRIRGARSSERVQTVYVAIRYAECLARPVRAMPVGCGCEEEVCEYSRTRDSFEIGCLDELPPSHAIPGLCELLGKGEVMPCLPCPEDPWVVLAKVERRNQIGILSEEEIDNMARRQIYSTAVLQEQLIACCCINQPQTTTETLQVIAVEFYDSYDKLRGSLYDQGSEVNEGDDGRLVILNLEGQDITTIQVHFSTAVDPSTLSTSTTSGYNAQTCSFLVEWISHRDDFQYWYIPGDVEWLADKKIAVFRLDTNTLKYFFDGKYAVTLFGTEDGQRSAINGLGGGALDGEVNTGLPSGDGEAGGDFKFIFVVRHAGEFPS